MFVSHHSVNSVCNQFSSYFSTGFYGFPCCSLLIPQATHHVHGLSTPPLPLFTIHLFTCCSQVYTGFFL